MRVPQWREDVLGWASKRGYKETGGGLWGELDGESAEDLTRPTRYFVLTVRDMERDFTIDYDGGCSTVPCSSFLVVRSRTCCYDVALDNPSL